MARVNLVSALKALGQLSPNLFLILTNALMVMIPTQKTNRAHGKFQMASQKKNIYGLKYSDLVAPILMKAIQEQQQLIEDLKSRIETLENK